MKKVVDVVAVGSTILVEMLTVQEDAGSDLAITGKPKQGRILAVGPALDAKWGFKPGDRVLLQGTFVPIPKFPGVAFKCASPVEEGCAARDIVSVDPHMIKATFVESEEETTQPCCATKVCSGSKKWKKITTI